MINREEAKRVIALYDELDEIKAAQKKLKSKNAEAMMTVYVGGNDDGVTLIINRELAMLTIKNKETSLLKELKETVG